MLSLQVSSNIIGIGSQHFLAGFDDAFKLLERLSAYVFDIPVDAAIGQFQQVNEAF